MTWRSIICKTEGKFSYHPRYPKHPVLELVCKPEVVEKKEGRKSRREEERREARREEGSEGGREG